MRGAAVHEADEGCWALLIEAALHRQAQVAARQLDAGQVLHAAIEALGGGVARREELAKSTIPVHILGQALRLIVSDDLR